MVTVIGQKPGGPVIKRTVEALDFLSAWGPWGPYLWQWARDKSLTIEGHFIRVVVHE